MDISERQNRHFLETVDILNKWPPTRPSYKLSLAEIFSTFEDIGSNLGNQCQKIKFSLQIDKMD